MDLLLTGVSNPSYRPYRHAHSNLVENHTQHAAESDLPIAGLLTDLKSRGLLDETLVLWHAELPGNASWRGAV